jgi:outer membrane protein TolC
MEDRRLRPWTILPLIPLLAGAAGDGPERPPDPLSLEWCLERASESNPDIAVDDAASRAAQYRINPAGSLDDPRFGYQLVNIPRTERDLDSTPMSGQQLGLSQKLPFPGLLDSRERAAAAAADAASQRLTDRRRRVASAVEASWAELGFAQRALAITDRNLDLLRQFAKIAEAKYRVGNGLQQDVLRAQVEITSLLQERLRRVAAIDTAEARLAALLDLPPGLALSRTTDLEDGAPLPDLGTLLGAFYDASPLLRELTARVAEAERRVRAAELEGYPDFDVSVGYRVRKRAPSDPVAGQDFLSAGVMIRLPVDRGKWRERVAERRALLRRAKERHRAGIAGLRNRLRASFAGLVRADSEVDLVGRGLIPQARQSLASSRSGYEVDKVDFLSLINSQVRQLEAELHLVRALADRRIAFAELESAFGEEIR